MTVQLPALERASVVAPSVQLIDPRRQRSEYPVVAAPHLGLARAMLKVRDTSLGEALAYRIAGILDIRVPRHFAFYADEPTEVAGEYIGRGAVGLLIEHFDDWRDVGTAGAAQLDPEFLGRVLALRTVMWYEPGEFGTSGNALYYIDLERVLPRADPHFLLEHVEEQERDEVLFRGARTYHAETRGSFRDALEEAREFGVMETFRQGVDRLASLTAADWEHLLNMEPHPLAPLLTPVYIRCVYRAVQASAAALHEQVDIGGGSGAP